MAGQDQYDQSQVPYPNPKNDAENGANQHYIDMQNGAAAAEAGRNNLAGQVAADQANYAAQHPPEYAAGGGSGLSNYQAVGQNYNGAPLGELTAESMRTGPSVWAGLAGREQGNLAENAKNQIVGQTAGQNASAEANLAMRGGLSGGARERVARQGEENTMQGLQGVNQQRTQNLFNINTQDELNREKQLSEAPGMQTQKAGLFGQANQYDTTNMNAYNADIYKSKMGYLGGKVASANQPDQKNGLFGLW